MLNLPELAARFSDLLLRRDNLKLKELVASSGDEELAHLLVAGLGGVAVPLVLRSLKVDPAVASTVFVTTMTDVCGFFVFLGLAGMFV